MRRGNKKQEVTSGWVGQRAAPTADPIGLSKEERLTRCVEANIRVQEEEWWVWELDERKKRWVRMVECGLRVDQVSEGGEGVG